MRSGMSEDLLQRVCRVVAETLNLPPAQVNGQTSPGNPEQWDSFAQLSIVLGLEQEFGVSLSPEQVEAMTSVDAIVRELS
jgi:acyl carrier protein